MNWNAFPEYDSFLTAGVVQGTPWAELAEKFTEKFEVPATAESLRTRWRRTGGATINAANDDTPESRVAAKIDLERARAADKAFAREMSSAIAQQARWQDFLDIVKGGLATYDRPAPQKLVLPKSDVKSRPEQFTQLIGDIHIGELVDPAVVGGSFGYNVPIFQERIARLEERMIRLFTLHSNTASFSSMRIYFLGDGVNNVAMHPDQAKVVDIPTATGQTLMLVYSMENLIRSLSVRLGVPIEIVWEFGNHGRVGKFGENLPADNWDYLAGQMLSIALRDMIADGRVKLASDALKYTITQLGPDRVISQHGDIIKGGDGFAGLPINGLARALAKATGLHMQQFDLYLVAHFHTAQDIRVQNGRILMNGAWTGGDHFSVNSIGSASEPVQVAFGVHPERGITWKSEIQLAPERRKPSPVTTL